MKIDERVVLIRINRLYRPTMGEQELYEATRKWWVLTPDRDPDYAFSVFGQVVKAVYRIDHWEQPPPDERVGRMARRWAFRGVRDREMESRYLGCNLSDYFRWGNANPIHYVNC